MPTTTPNLALVLWTSLTDPYDHTELAGNFAKIDEHDHTGGFKGKQIGTSALVDGSITAAKIAVGAIADYSLADGDVTTTKINNLAVTTGKIAAGAVTRAKLASSLIQTRRVSTGSIAATVASTISVIWSTPFADNNYTVSATLEDDSGDLEISKYVQSKSATGFSIVIHNRSATTARTGTVHGIGIAD